ncbi:hypothetical protein BP6252_08477 [Coleophoma cylindrospora]|uniref:2EXR domain-containing protein n=1 Tax=Coleophoma cylindrospora TaxID=1849047 RepID=A0A3D8R630_9HELO|nr:hypothetical protein BP6252_08477 [Coleophoma cylindrospora]
MFSQPAPTSDVSDMPYPTPTLNFFERFSDLAPEIRIKVWQFACAARIVTIRYQSEHDRCVSGTPPPVLLSTNRESRAEALRFYQLAFGTKSSPSKIHFNPYRDTLYLPRHRLMGYDDTLRDFRSYLADPRILDDVRYLALDHVDVEVKRPWESYNKAALIRDFPMLKEMFLVLCERGRSKGGKHEDVIFAAPREDPEDLLRMWVDFRQAFVKEQMILEEVSREIGKHCVQCSLPTVRIRSKTPRRQSADAIPELDGMSNLRIS